MQAATRRLTPGHDDEINSWEIPAYGIERKFFLKGWGKSVFGSSQTLVKSGYIRFRQRKGQLITRNLFECGSVREQTPIESSSNKFSITNLKVPKLRNVRYP